MDRNEELAFLHHFRRRCCCVSPRTLKKHLDSVGGVNNRDDGGTRGERLLVGQT
jgi:hypothetical protein